jgi:hypothetical protein
MFMALVLAASSCQTGTGSNNAQPANTTAANSGPAVNANAGENADLTGYSLATPSETYRTALEARQKCDIPVLKRVMSQEMLAAMTELGENNPGGKRSLDEMLNMLCKIPQAPNAGEIKDEKIVEDEATIKYKDETGAWRLMDFVREDGEWKLTMPRGNSELPALK